jgi:hypothetical protein
VEGCDRVPFAPTATIQAETAQSDEPDGATVDVAAAQNVGAEELNTADIRDARLTLPEGLTLNPSAARGLRGCSAAQIAIGSTQPVTCPAASRIGSVALETDLPPGSLSGGVYLGAPSGAAISGPPYTIYLDAESQLGVSVRLAGLVSADPSTGRLQATFTDNPPLPFSSLTVSLNGGPFAPLANPLLCGAGELEATFTPYTAGAAFFAVSPFATGGCTSSPPPFELAQSTTQQATAAGAYSSYTFDLARGDGQQYLQRVSATLPAGLLGAIRSVALCGEPQAAAGSCGEASRIGTATALAGAGPDPYSFSGPVYLTASVEGAPYGLSIPIRAAAGPFDLGTVVTRAALGVGLYDGRVTVTSTLPTIVGGVPLRVRDVHVVVDRPSFLFNPTSCGPLATESLLTSTMGARRPLSSPLRVTGCGSLAFKLSLTASAGGHPSKASGESFQTKITQGARQANLREVLVTLPKQLPTRLTTLQKACPAALFERGAPPGACPSTSQVGSVSVTTPVLAGSLAGPAYLVSHGGAGFPDLDLVLHGDGVEVVLVGHTQISRAGVTTSRFETLPDVPISSATVTLPSGPRSLLAANDSLCRAKLAAPTILVAQSGARISRSTSIAVSGCPVLITTHRAGARAATIGLLLPAAGRITVSGHDLRTVTRRVAGAGRVKLKVELTRSGLRAARMPGPLRLELRVRFVARAGHGSSKASTLLVFR